MNRQWLGFGFVVTVALIFVGRQFFGPNPQRAADLDRQVAARGLADAVATRLAGKRAIVLSNPFVKKAGTDRRILSMEEAGLRGLQEGAAPRLTIEAVVLPELLPSARENPRSVAIDTTTTTPLSYLVAPGAFDHAAQAHPACDVLFSLIGLPVDLDQCSTWKKSGAPSFALLLPDLRIIGSPGDVLAATKSGKLLAFVVRKPGGVGAAEPVGKDWRAEFERRFLLVTADNIDAVSTQSPGVLENP